MDILRIKTCVGIGDLLHLKQLLDDMKNNYSSVEISLDHEIIRSYKSNYDEYLTFINSLFIKLFSEPPYKICEDINSKTYSPTILARNFSQTPRIPNLEKYFCENNNKTEDIIILTKIRGFHRENYEKIKTAFINLLNKISKNRKIILVGERNIGANREYDIHGIEYIYSIYKDLISNINSFEDKTIEELGFTSPNIDNFYKDCNILNQAKAVICLGSGGNVSMAMATSNIVNFYGASEMESLFSLMPAHETKFITNNIINFYEKLEQLI
jgi:hypothetical protein